MEKTSQPRIRRASGFATAALIVWLPLLLTLVAALTVVASALLERTRTQGHCWRVAVRAQSELRDQLQSLLALNPRAHRLQKLRALAEARWKAALLTGQPALIAKAQAERTAVISQQMALSLRQQRILARAREIRLVAREELRERLQRLSARLHPDRDPRSAGLAVSPQPVDSLSPVWSLRPNFLSLQSQRMDYTFSLFRQVPPWVRQNLNLPSEQGASCSATLAPRGPGFALATRGGKL